jgi:hypothetical protein
MQNFSRLAAISLRASAFAMIIALSACKTEGTIGSTSTEESGVPIAAVAAADSTMSAVNIAPAISGTPATAAMLGAAYSFTPSATDVNSDTLTFSIQNKPSWATFNAATGQLVGTPDSAGIAANVVISVSDGKATTKLTPFAITVSAGAGSHGSALVSWNAPTVKADGSVLTDLAGYHVYYGADPGNLTRADVEGASNLTYTASNLAPGIYYFTVTAYNSAGLESAQPAVISTVIG